MEKIIDCFVEGSKRRKRLKVLSSEILCRSNLVSFDSSRVVSSRLAFILNSMFILLQSSLAENHFQGVSRPDWARLSKALYRTTMGRIHFMERLGNVVVVQSVNWATYQFARTTRKSWDLAHAPAAFLSQLGNKYCTYSIALWCWLWLFIMLLC